MAEVQPIAPPTNEIAPVVPTASGVPVIQPQEPKSIDQKYEEAATSRDPDKMMLVAKEAGNNPVGRAAMDAANVMYRTSKQFDDLVNPIAKLGGLQTPEGRIKFQDTWKTVKDDPKVGTAILEALLGNPNARLFVTGGTVKVNKTFDDNGNMLEEHVNELGQREKVIDVATQLEVTPAEYEKRRGGITSLAETLSRKAQTAIQESNVAEFNKQQKGSAANAAAADMFDSLGSEKLRLMGELRGSELTDEQRKLIAGVGSRQVGFTQSVTDGQNAFNQYVSSRGQNADQKLTKAAEAYLQRILPGAKLNANGSVTDSKGNTVSSSDLENIQKQASSSLNYEQNYTQTKADLAASIVYGSLSNSQKMLLDRVLEIDRMVEGKRAELSKEYGTPSFLVNPSAFSITDQYARGEVQGLMTQFNARAIAAYQSWKTDMLANYGKGEVPAPGQLENAFVKTDIYKNLKTDFMKQSKEILSRPLVTNPVRTIEEEARLNAPAGLSPTLPNKALPEAKGETPKAKGRSEETRTKLRDKFRS
jgi:hypothetical protein